MTGVLSTSGTAEPCLPPLRAGRFWLPPGSNLPGMARYILRQKLDIVAQWERSGLSQDAFLDCHPVGISSRTLRSWVALGRRPEQALARRMAIVEEAIRDWVTISEAMGRKVAVPESTTEVVEVPEGQSVPGGPHEVPQRLPMPPAWYFVG